ncbi:MAG: hypothetical protein ACLVJ6_03250 [Merdibacter sp.]
MAFLYVGYAMGFEDFRLMTYRNPAVVIFTLLSMPWSVTAQTV